MPSHLGQSIANHVTLELVGGINGGFGPELLGWVRILPDGNIESGPDGGNYVVPAEERLVITDLDWQYDDHAASNAGALVTLRLFVVDASGADSRLMESTIVLSPAGQGVRRRAGPPVAFSAPARKSASTPPRCRPRIACSTPCCTGI